MTSATATASEIELVRAWLVFMDRKYNLNIFKKENKRVGTVKKVGLDKLQNMMWGDRICHFYQSGGIKFFPSWFATWPITKILGLSKQAVRHIADNSESRACDMGGAMTLRADCRYTTGITYLIDGSLKRIALLLRGFEATGGEIGNPMIGCGAGIVKYMKAPFPLFPNITVDPDEIRPFNYLEAKAHLNKARSKKSSTSPEHKIIAKAFYFLSAMEDPEREWPDNTLANFPAKNYQEDMEGGVGGGLVQAALDYVSVEHRSEHITL